MENNKLNFTGRMAKFFVYNGKLTALFLFTIIIVGVFSFFTTPKEEDPQVIVPAFSIYYPVPGFSNEEIEEWVVKPQEARLKDISGVEDVYSTSMNDVGIITVRFFVGENREKSTQKLYDRIQSSQDLLPLGAGTPVVKPIDIDEVPIVGITFRGENWQSNELYSLALEVSEEIKKMEDVNYTNILGGENREIRIEMYPSKMASLGVSAYDIQNAIALTNLAFDSGNITTNEENIFLRSEGLIQSKKDLEKLVIKVNEGKVVYLTDVADILDTFEEKNQAVFSYKREETLQNSHNPDSASLSDSSSHSLSQNGSDLDSSDNPVFKYGVIGGKTLPSVSVVVAKKSGVNAVILADKIVEKVNSLEIPSGVEVIISKDSGKSASDAVSNLSSSLAQSIIIVIAILLLFLGYREASIVAIAIPLTVAVVFGAGMLAGQTINRITLFALILSLGLLVDSAIVITENIYRHIQLKHEDRKKASVEAVNEVGLGLVMSTITTVLAFYPMKFISGMMGPYMGPIPFNVPVALIASTVIAFSITPWISAKIIKAKKGHLLNKKQIEDHDDKHFSPFTKKYGNMLESLLKSRKKRNVMISIISIIFVLTMSMPAIPVLKFFFSPLEKVEQFYPTVNFQLLPKADKNSFYVNIDLPVSAPYEKTEIVARQINDELARNNLVKDTHVFVGTAPIINFNGLFKMLSARTQENQATILINLVHKNDRKETSTEIVNSLRPILQGIGKENSAEVFLLEDPPGPPVRSTMLAIVKAPNNKPETREKSKKLALEIEEIFQKTEGLIDIDISVEDSAKELVFEIDQEKAQLSGVSVASINSTLFSGIKGQTISLLRDKSEKEVVNIFLRFKEDFRNELDDLSSIELPSVFGGTVPLSELTHQVFQEKSQNIYHENLYPSTYIKAELLNREPIYAVMEIDKKIDELDVPSGFKISWSGEWKMTLDVFMDLGRAFMIAFFLIYVALVVQFRSFRAPALVMMSIPLGFMGVFPGFWILGMTFNATAMIGTIALAGIVVNNAIIMLEYLKILEKEGMEIIPALKKTAMTRSRPIILTSLTTIFSSITIAIGDPVWAGLGWAIIWGLSVSTLLTLFIFPLFYYVFENKNWGKI